MYIHLVKSQTPQRNKCDSEIYILLCYFLTGRLVSSLKLWPRSWKSKVFPVVNWLTSGFVYATDCLWIANTCIPTRKGNTNQTSLKSFWPDIHFKVHLSYTCTLTTQKQQQNVMIPWACPFHTPNIPDKP